MPPTEPHIRDVACISVKSIKRTHLEQLYGTRGELNEEPDGPSKLELAIGECPGGVIIKNMSTGRLRMVWTHRYLVSLGLCHNRTPEEEQARKAAIESLPQIFVG